MARIAGVDLPRHKHIALRAPYLFGIGPARAQGDLRSGRHPREQEDRGAHRERDQDASASSSRPTTRSRATCAARSDEHQAPDGPRLLPRPPSPPRPAGQRSAHAHQRAHPQGPAQGRCSPRAPAKPTTVSLSSVRGIQATMSVPPQREHAVDRRPSRRAAPRRRSRRTSRPASRTSSRPSTTRSSRSPTSTATPWRGRAPGSRGFKGSRKSTPFAAQLAAEEAARKAHGARHALGRRVREGPRRRPRERAPRAPDGGFKVTLIRDVTPDPAQRLPPAQAPPRLTTFSPTKNHSWLVTSVPFASSAAAKA